MLFSSVFGLRVFTEPYTGALSGLMEFPKFSPHNTVQDDKSKYMYNFQSTRKVNKIREHLCFWVLRELDFPHEGLFHSS